MKNTVKRINTYLTEHYPLIWNTRLVWITAIALIIHILFFAAGYLSLSITGALTQYSLRYSIAGSQVYMFSILISIVLVVLWLVQLFKNNAFKNFYPFSRLQLLGSFLIYFFIVFISSTFYLSYISGAKAYVTHNFSESRMQDELDKSNLAAAFLTYNSANYELSNKSYPAPFDTLYCETNYKVNETLPFVADSFGAYQFYTIKKDSIPIKVYRDRKYDIPVIASDTYDSFYVFYKKVNVVDMRGKASPDLNFYNYSATRFDDGSGSRYSSRYSVAKAVDNSSISSFEEKMKRCAAQNKKVYELLQRNNPEEIKKLMRDFLSVANYYGVQTNLTEAAWYPLINASDGFKVKSFIRNNNSDTYANVDSAVSGSSKIADIQIHSVDAAATASDTAQDSKYAIRKLPVTGFYFNDDELNNVFTNVSAMRIYSVFDDVFYAAFWVAFFFASILFAFRVTGYKELLFAVIASIIITMIDSMILIGIGHSDKPMYYVMLISMLAVFSISLLGNIRKRITGIFLNISIVIFVPFFFVMLLLISQYQSDAYYRIDRETEHYVTPTILDQLGTGANWVLFFAGLICLYCYTAVIKKWKALPEQ